MATTERARRTKRKYYATNGERARAAAKKHYAANRDKILTARKKFYVANRGAVLEQKREHFAANREKYIAYRRKQVGRTAPTRPEPAGCELCGAPPKRAHLDEDHDYVTKLFRGWLCSQCNMAIGLLKDNPAVALKVVDYLIFGGNV